MPRVACSKAGIFVTFQQVTIRAGVCVVDCNADPCKVGEQPPTAAGRRGRPNWPWRVTSAKIMSVQNLPEKHTRYRSLIKGPTKIVHLAQTFVQSLDTSEFSISRNGIWTNVTGDHAFESHTGKLK